MIEEDKVIYDQARSQILSKIAIYNLKVVRMLKLEKNDNFQ